MASAKQFNATMREWTEVFMHRSMREWSIFVKSTGLSMPQFSILMKIYYGGGCGVTDISTHLDVTNAAASQLVDRLVHQGLIDRVEDPHDRRAKQITLAAKGKNLILKGIEARHRWFEDLSNELSNEDQSKITAALTQLTEAVRKIETPKS